MKRCSLFLALIFSIGCDSDPTPSGPSEMERMSQALSVQKEAEAKAAADAAAAKAAEEEAARLAAEKAAQEPQKVEFDGNRGNAPTEEPRNYLAAVGHAYVATQDKAISWQITSAMKSYQATNGYFPKTHEEYMKRIIEENSIELTPLENPAEEYWYNPEDHELYIRPIPAAGAEATPQP